QQAADLMSALRKEGLLAPTPFSQRIDFIYFDLWHYDGRTSKHGAFMGGADFVQWHGNYPMLARTVELREQADELRRRRGRARPGRAVATRSSALDRAVRPAELRRARARHLPGALAEPVQAPGRVHPAVVLGRGGRLARGSRAASTDVASRLA